MQHGRDVKRESTANHFTRVSPRLARFVPLASAALIALLYAGWWRPIWYDELLHFAMGGMTFEYALKTIDYTTIEVNHGQTGVYLLLDWVLLQIFGASAIALRAPSLVSALAMLLAVIVFLRAKGLGWKWQSVAVAAFGANSTLMFFVGEARPYMPMAASTIAMLAYYALGSDDRRTWWGRCIGVFGFLVGAVMHPYWILMWFLMATFSVADYVFRPQAGRHLKALISFLSPKLVASGLLLYVVTGQLTWMRRVLNFGADPGWTYDWSVIWASFGWSHFAFSPQYMPVRSSSWPTLVSELVIAPLAALALIVAISLLFVARCRTRDLLPPAGLVLTGVLSSALLTLVSFRSNYLILERQWVAGMAISTLGLAWFFAVWWRNVRKARALAMLPVWTYLGLVTVSFAAAAATQMQLTIERLENWTTFQNDPRTIEEFVADPGAQTFVYDPIEGYEYMANVNIARGGPVWEEFVAWYNKWSGMRPEFRESNPGWTRFIWPQEAAQSRLCIPQLCP